MSDSLQNLKPLLADALRSMDRQDWMGRLWAIVNQAHQTGFSEGMVRMANSLPSTVDGVPVVPGMKLFAPVKNYDHLIVTAVHTHNSVSLESIDVLGQKQNEWNSVPVGNCYSTREAAIKAWGKGGNTNEK